MLLRFILPWALAGFAGWYAPRFIHLKEEWQQALVAAIAGVVAGWLIHYL